MHIQLTQFVGDFQCLKKNNTRHGTELFSYPKYKKP